MLPSGTEGGSGRKILEASYGIMISYVLAAGMGLGLAMWTLPATFVFPTDPQAGPFFGDMAQHVVGQRYFIADDWRWPVLIVPRLGEPPGAHIGLLDAIPLLAIALKSVRVWLPPGFHGIGLWYGIAWVVQPLAAVWCIRAAGERRIVPVLCMAVICVSIPAWWDRFPHAALTTHGLLLLGLGTYFVLLRRPRAATWIGVILLLVITLAVHPYLLAMNGALLAAAPVTLWLRRSETWRAVACGVIGAVTVIAFLMWLLGYIGGVGEGGFGRFGMNLISPVWPAGSWFLGGGVPKIHAQNASGWEGYNYLGLGLLGGLGLSVALMHMSVYRHLRVHVGLLAVLAVFVLIAVTNRAGLGYSRVIEIYPAWGILEVVRGSGRFFWPVTYALALGMVMGLAKLRDSRWRNCLLVGFALLQFVDVQPLRVGFAERLRAAPSPWAVDAPGMRGALAAHDSVTLLPRWNCLAGHADQGYRGVALDVVTLASEFLLPVNTMYMARWPEAATCRQPEATPEPGTRGLAIVISAIGQQHITALTQMGLSCVPAGPVVMCSRNEAARP
jgi:hypothetical protein